MAEPGTDIARLVGDVMDPPAVQAQVELVAPQDNRNELVKALDEHGANLQAMAKILADVIKGNCLNEDNLGIYNLRVNTIKAVLKLRGLDQSPKDDKAAKLFELMIQRANQRMGNGGRP